MTHLALCLRHHEETVEIAGYAEDELTGAIHGITLGISFKDYVEESPASIAAQHQIRDWAHNTPAEQGLIDFKGSLLPHIAGWKLLWVPIHKYFPNYDRKAEPSALAAAKKIVKSRINKP